MRIADDISPDGWELKTTEPEKMNWILSQDAFYVYSSDFHGSEGAITAEQVGDVYSVVMAEENSEEAIREALLAKRVVIIRYGVVYGLPEAIELYNMLKEE